MIKAMTDRPFLSPVVAFTFVPVALTGVLLLFHLHLPGMMSIHKWIGLGFTLFCIFHIAVNWKILVKYLNRKGARSALVLAVVLTVVCGVFGLGDKDGRPGEHGGVASAYVKRK